MSTTTKGRLAPNTPAAKNAIAQLKADHAKVSGLFATYDKTRSVAKKKARVADICMELRVHAQIEASSLDLLELGARITSLFPSPVREQSA